MFRLFLAPRRFASLAAPQKKTKPATKPKGKGKELVRVPKGLKPPKRAPGPYFLFFSTFLKSHPKPSSLLETQDLCKRASAIWNGYSMAEKQPFYDENETRKVQAKEARDEFFRNMSISSLKKLNAIRQNQGKPKVHSTNKSPVALSPYLLFSNEFRDSLEGQALINETAPEKKYPVRAIIAASKRWKSMTEKEKEPYVERHQKEKEAIKAAREQAQSA